MFPSVSPARLSGLLLYLPEKSTPLPSATSTVGTRCVRYLSHEELGAQAVLEDAGRCGAPFREVKEEAEGRGTRTKRSATAACVQK